MPYTIRIQDKSLKALKNDYDFIEIEKDNNKNNNSEQDIELEKRYKSFQKSKKGKYWKDLKKELI